jgi:DNA transposition AAA+ family ATPase
MTEQMTIRDLMRQRVDNGEITIKAISQAVGKSTATISLWIAGKYTGNVDEIEAAVTEWQERQHQREIDAVTCLETSVFKKLNELASLAHTQGGLYVGFGAAGIGKTTAIRSYAEIRPSVILIEVDRTYTTLALMRELHRKCGFDGSGSLHSIMADLITKLKSSQRLIIIDEAEHLPARALDILRSLYDKTGIGIMLVGLEQLIANLRGVKYDFRQLYSRVNLAIRLEECSDDDVAKLVHHAIPGSNGLWKAFAKRTRNARSLDKLIKQAKRLASINRIGVDAALVDETAQLLIL